jgi:hypothetical protein
MYVLTRGLATLSVLIAASVVLAAPNHTDATATPGEKCAVAKLRATSKKAAAKVVCYEKAVLNGQAVDLTCLMKAEAAFALAFQKAEARGGCATTGDASTIEAKVDRFVKDAVMELPPTPRTTTSSTTTTTTTTSTTTTTGVCIDIFGKIAGSTCTQDVDCPPLTGSCTSAGDCELGCPSVGGYCPVGLACALDPSVGAVCTGCPPCPGGIPCIAGRCVTAGTCGPGHTGGRCALPGSCLSDCLTACVP